MTSIRTTIDGYCREKKVKYVNYTQPSNNKRRALI
jgi:hypothetical protein